jgi:hypothetical protein
MPATAARRAAFVTLGLPHPTCFAHPTCFPHPTCFSHPTLRTEGGSGKLLVADRLRGATVGRYSGASWQAISSGIIYLDQLFEHVLWENQLGARGEPFTFCEQIIRLFLSPLSKPLFLNPRPTVRGLRCRKPHEIIGVFPSLRSYVSSATCASHTASYYLPNFWAEDYPKSFTNLSFSLWPLPRCIRMWFLCVILAHSAGLESISDMLSLSRMVLGEISESSKFPD